MATDGIKTFCMSDDDAVVRKGIRHGLDEVRGFTVIGEASTFASTVELLSQHSPELLLQDLELPNRSEPEIIRDLRERFPDLASIALSGLDRNTIREVLASGTNGYTSKEEGRIAFISAAEWVRNGAKSIYLAPSEEQPNITSERTIVKTKRTWREVQILRLLEESISAIARKLGITEGTVKNYVSNIFQKVGVTNRLGAIRYARENGFMPR